MPKKIKLATHALTIRFDGKTELLKMPIDINFSSIEIAIRRVTKDDEVPVLRSRKANA